MKRFLPFVTNASAVSNFRLMLSVVLILCGISAFAQPGVLGSQVVNGTYSTTNLNTVGGFKQVRLQASSSAGTGTRVWEFASGTAASTNYNPNWRPYTSGNTLSVNNFIPVGFANGARYNTGGGASGLLPAITTGNYYTFNVSNNSASDNVMALLETTYNPVTILAVTNSPSSGGARAVSITTSATPGSGENIFVRYSTNSYTSSAIVLATGSGTSYTALIPVQTATVSFYVYTSNRSLANINSDVTTYGQPVHDMSTLNLENNGGSNYNYTTTSGTIAYNDIVATNPSASNPFNTGQVVITNATASGIGRGVGLTAATVADRYSASAWSFPSFDATDYFEFIITPSTGYRLNFDNFQYTGQSSATGPVNFTLRSSLDGYVADIATLTQVGGTTASKSISLAGAAYQSLTSAITFRLYGYNGTNIGGTFSVNDYSFNGTVTAVPAQPILAISGTTSHGTVCPTVSATPITYTITNTGTVAAAGVTVVSNDPQFVVSALSSTTIAASGGTATYIVTFTPSSAGSKSATITAASTTSGSNSPTSSLTGAGATPVTAVLTTSAASAVVNTTATLNGNVTALGVCPATTEKGFVYSLTATNPSPVVGGTGVTKTAVAGVATGTYSLGLSGLAPNSGYSFTAYVYNGTSYTYGTVLTFTTLAVADHLTFTGVPASGFTTTNLASFNVEARRPDNTVDTEYIGNVTISKASGPGTLSGTLTIAATAGVAAFNTAQFNTAGTYTLGAASGALTGATSGNIIITLAPVVLAGWDFTGQSSPATFAATTFNANLISASGGSNITRGAGAVSNGAGNSFRTAGFQNNGISTANTDYFQTTLTTNPGVTMSLAAINAIYNGTATFSASPGVTSQYAYSLDGTTFILIGSPVTSTVTSAVLSVDLSSVTALQNIAPNTTVTFRYYASGQTTTGGWGYFSPSSGNNGLAFTGNITCVQPVAYAVTGGGTVCSGSGTAVGLANSQAGISYQLQRGGVDTGSPIAGTGSAITFGSQTVAGTYTVVASNTNGTCSLTTSMTGNAVITINPTSVAGTISGAATVCTGTNSTTLTLSGNTGTIQWQFSTNGGSTYSNISSETSSTYTAINLTATTYYRAVVTSGVCPSATTSAVIITVSPASVAGTISGAGTVCTGANSTTLTLSGNTGSIQWQISTNGGVSYTNLTGETASTYIAANLTATTYYRAVVISGACASATTAPVSITVNPASVAGSISGAGTVCTGTNSTTLTLSGSTGTIQWQISTNGGVSFTNLTGETASTYTAANLTATTYYQAVVISGVCASATTAPVSITVNPASVAGSISGAGTVCTGTNSTTLTLSGNTGSIQWQISTNGGVSYTNLTGATASTYTAANLTATTYYQAVVISGVCASATTAPVSITVTAASVAGTVSSDQAICSGSQPADITLAGSTGTIQWQSSADNSTFTDISGQNAATLSGAAIGPLTATAYYRAIVTSGVCASATSAVVTVTVGGSTTWNGTAWSNGVPNGFMGIIITGNYTSSGSISGCSLSVTSGAAVIISAGDDFTINSSVTVAPGSSLTVSNTANLIQISNASNSGSVIVQCDSNPLMRQDYTMWSSPVSGPETLQEFSVGTLPTRFYTYNPGTNLYNAIADPSAATFSAGTGYLIRVPNTHPNTPTVWSGEFEGTPNNGNLNLAVSSGTYNGIGNPYPSAIDADAFINGNGLTEALYFWRKTNNSANTSYATYTLAGGAGTSDNSGDPNALIPNGVIRAGQGFIAKSTSATLAFTNSMRSADNDGVFFRSQNVDRSRIWIDLSNTDGAFSQAMVAYMPGATMGVDAAIDGKYFNDSELALTSLIDNVEYAVQGRALPFSQGDIVPLGFKVITAGTYTIAIDHFDGLFVTPSQGIFFRDNLTGILHDLRAGAYTFAAEAGVANNRFQIEYQLLLATESQVWDAGQVVVYKNNGELVINSGNIKMDKIRIFDIRGRLITGKENINASEVRIDAGTAQEVLIVKITSDDGKTVTKKAVN